MVMSRKKMTRRRSSLDNADAQSQSRVGSRRFFPLGVFAMASVALVLTITTNEHVTVMLRGDSRSFASKLNNITYGKNESSRNVTSFEILSPEKNESERPANIEHLLPKKNDSESPTTIFEEVSPGKNYNEKEKQTKRFEEVWPKISDKLCPNYSPNLSFTRILFAMAGDELLGLSSRGQRKYDFNARLVTKFYVGDFAYGSQERFKFSNSSYLSYVPIWKCGNDNIRHFLSTHFKRMNTPTAGGLKRQCTVTAVRDPISHFLSGYNEVESRWESEDVKDFGEETIPGPLRLPYMSKPQGTPERFETLLSNMLIGMTSTRMTHWMYLHFFSMSRVLPMLKRRRDPITAYLPTIANLSETFPIFLGENCPEIPKSVTEGPMTGWYGHGSSSDPYGSYNASNTVWKSAGSHARALCVIHAMDYACWRDLPDGVPKLCQEVFTTPDFVSTFLNQTFFQEWAGLITFGGSAPSRGIKMSSIPPDIVKQLQLTGNLPPDW